MKKVPALLLLELFTVYHALGLSHEGKLQSESMSAAGCIYMITL